MCIDKKFCMSSYLMYRYIIDKNKSFSETKSRIVDISFPRTPVKDARDLLEALKENIEKACNKGNVAIALSGGIDSAILAKLVPKGTKAYTFRCIVDGKKVIDETLRAKHWAELNNLEHEIINITWNDLKEAAKTLMIHKGAPIHSIEAQIYIAANKALQSGADKFIFGENADIIYGGMNGLLEKDWLFSEFVDRYTYVMPYKVLKEFELILEPYKEFEDNGYIDGHNFINKYFRQEALGTYINACETAGIEFIGPYSRTYLDKPIDYDRIRNGDTKYIIRELFNQLYPNEKIPEKIPMPRPLDEWLSDWTGPIRNEFWPHCTDNMTGDQKWMVWALEQYLNILEISQYKMEE